MEKVDIINAHDELIGQETRAKAHKEGLLHRGVFVMVFNPEGKLLMQQRSPENEFYCLKWEGSLSGHCQAGESYHKTACRELREELFINTTPAKLDELLTFWLHDENERMNVKLFVLRDIKDEAKIMSEEVLKAELWPVERVKKELKETPDKFSPAFKKSWQLFLELKEKSKDYLSLSDKQSDRNQ